MGQCYEMGDDPTSAGLCYERILVFQPDSPEAKEALYSDKPEVNVVKVAYNLIIY